MHFLETHEAKLHAHEHNARVVHLQVRMDALMVRQYELLACFERLPQREAAAGAASAGGGNNTAAAAPGSGNTAQLVPSALGSRRGLTVGEPAQLGRLGWLWLGGGCRPTVEVQRERGAGELLVIPPPLYMLPASS